MYSSARRRISSRGSPSAFQPVRGIGLEQTRALDLGRLGLRVARIGRVACLLVRQRARLLVHGEDASRRSTPSNGAMATVTLLRLEPLGQAEEREQVRGVEEEA